jgi:pyruvate/2-oxoglutarate/acetoin dehydrogenase E1 component
VIVIENRNLYLGEKTDVTTGGEPRPLGWSHLRRRGSDVTVVSWGAVTQKVLDAAGGLAEVGCDVEVVEPTWLNPLDLDAILASVSRTRRLVVVHEANVTGGFGAEVVARVAEAGVSLDAPPVRLGTPDMRIPAAPVLAQQLIPSTERIAAAISAAAGRPAHRGTPVPV